MKPLGGNRRWLPGLVVSVIGFGVLAGEARGSTSPQESARRSASADHPALHPFEERVAAYAALRERVERAMPPFNETGDPAKLTAREQALAAALIKERAGVTEGDVFAPESHATLRAIIRRDFSTRTRADKQALEEDLPPRAHVRANAEYPEGLLVVTVPPSLLKALPALPDDIEYRLVGSDLILLDTRASLVVDVLRGAVPR